MAKFDGLKDFLTRQLRGKVLVSIDDEEVREEITASYILPSLMVIETIGSGREPHKYAFPYDTPFVTVPRVIEFTNETMFDNDSEGDLFTAEEFAAMVESGAIIDNDGFGYPSDGTKHACTFGVSVAVLASAKYSNTVSHVLWYNK